MRPTAARDHRPIGYRKLGVAYKLAIIIYVVTVVLFSYQDHFTLYAKVAGGALAALFLFRVVSTSDKVPFPTEYKILFAWLLVGLISSVLSSDPEVAFYRILTLLQIFPLAFVVSVFILWNRSSRFYWAALIGAAAVCASAAMLYPERFVQIDGRMFGTLEHPNNFGALMAVCASLCLARFARIGGKLTKALLAVAAVGFLYLVGRTGSRTGTLASIAGATAIFACVYVARYRKSAISRAGIFMFGGLFVAGVVAYLTSTAFSGRVMTLFDAVLSGNLSGVGEQSLAGRAWMYKKGFEVFLEHPVLGLGLDMFRAIDIVPGQVVGHNSHSNYIEILVNTGLVGGILYYGMYYCWWSRLVNARSLVRDPRYAEQFSAAVSIAVIVLVFDVGFVGYYQKVTWLILAGLIADANLLSGIGGTASGGGVVSR